MNQERDVKLARQWSRNPNSWFKAFFPNETLTVQQEKAFDEIGKIVSAKMKRRDGETLTAKDEIYANKIGISIQSGKGTGKDAWAALVILWFLSNFPFPKIPCTANSAQQLKNVLWSEIAKWMQKSRMGDKKPILEELFEWQSEKIFFKAQKGKRWFAEAVTVSVKASAQEQEAQAAAMAGRHEENLMAVVDEASGIADAVFSKLEETFTQSINFMVIIFNPTRTKGYAIESQKDKRFVSIRWNSEDCERVSKAHIQGIADKYGKDSNPYRVGVLGLPPHSDQNTLIVYDWIMDAVERELSVLPDDPVIKGVDVGAGGDKSVIATRQGGIIRPLERFNTKDTMHLVGHVVKSKDRDSAKAVIIDPIGVGKGVYDRLRENHQRIYAGDVRRTARNEQKYHRVRDELWWKVREQFEKGLISIPNDQDLIDQLSAIKSDEPDSQGREKIISKKEMKKNIDGSPDEADALALTYFMEDAIFRPQAESDDDPDYRGKKKKEESLGWMAA